MILGTHGQHIQIEATITFLVVFGSQLNVPRHDQSDNYSAHYWHIGPLHNVGSCI